MSNHVSNITDDSFDAEVVQSQLPVLVDFWAQWCGPCKAIAPIVDDLAQQYVGKLKVVKLDIDQNPSIPPRFGVRGIPTLILFEGGQVKGTLVGMRGKAELAEFIDGHI